MDGESDHGVVASGLEEKDHAGNAGTKVSMLTPVTESACITAEEVAEDRSHLKDTTCGWCMWRPRMLKPCSSMKWFLFFLSLNGLLFNLIAYGLTAAVLTTLEKRFHFSSTEIGVIVSSNYFTSMILSVVVAYMGEKGNKPVWVGVGTLLLAVGAFIFALPHFLADSYHVPLRNQSAASNAVCPTREMSLINISSEPERKCTAEEWNRDGNDANYLWMFIVASVFFGYSNSPFATLGITYMDENLAKTVLGLYMGIVTASKMLGSAIGFLVGAQTLAMYTDVLVDESSLPISQDNPLWIGAWWLGYIVAGVFTAILAVFVMGFPKMQPGKKNFAEKHQSETKIKSGRRSCTEVILGIPRAFLNLITHPSYVAICFAIAMEWFVSAGVEVFSPKYFETQLNMTSSEVAGIIGVITLTARLSGALFSGIFMKCLNLKFKGLMKVCVVCVLLSSTSALMFNMSCPSTVFASVTTGSSNWSSTSDEGRLSAPCNSHCDCTQYSFDPVCGSDGVMYYSPCHAGCAKRRTFDNEEAYYGCQCLLNGAVSYITNGTGKDTNYFESQHTVLSHRNVTADESEGRAVLGRCSTTCPHKWPLFVLMWTFLFINNFIMVIALTGILRCIPHSQRAFALGVQELFAGLACAMSPIVFGYFIDKSCKLVERLCTGAPICWFYDNRVFANTLLGLILSSKLLSLVLFVVVHIVYRPLTAEWVEKTDEVHQHA